MLKLVVDNDNQMDKAATNVITCRNSCELFDDITESCSIKQNINVDSAFELKRCGNFFPKLKQIGENTMKTRFSLIEEDDEYLIEDEDMFKDLIGSQFNHKESTYPNIPDYPARREDAMWYVSPSGTFGCWIINHSASKFLSIPKDGLPEQGWSEKVYKSPLPLHDHKTSLSLASKMAWFVDADGFGQYVLLVNGRISTLTSPRPKNWNKEKQ